MREHDERVVASDVDLRGFVHPLDAVRARQQWRLDRLRVQLASAQAAVSATAQLLAEARCTHDTQAQAAGHRLRLRPDPAAHRTLLAFLTHWRERARELERQLEEQRAEQERVRAECTALQLRIEGLRTHRVDALARYAGEMRQRQRVEQDRDWLARSVRSRSTFKESR